MTTREERAQLREYIRCRVRERGREDLLILQPAARVVALCDDVDRLESKLARAVEALKAARAVAADRRRFVLEGPRAFQGALDIIDAALRDIEGGT